ncbi:M55 family metallopeptidase [Tepidimicrobium xylanilyticum]|uniref:D-amino peptidase n=1 Tax=Tepidimicrobium xylanilyticum TaxID=1123352 RepID=A0A1H2V4A3_9FIRM|nr:M55 family metallopeptidase [Tepidimicrobium xylanilyticum]GMG96734.1 amino acid amidase [Tepidimicrobium xylanilyticum]SDW63172.1 D-amino peptidase [Tepidimicrobium xylanilyticum]
MKIYISADIEGVTGVTHWNETEKSEADYKEFAHQMTLEVKAACEGAINAGADEIWVKDAHDSARNIDHNLLPKSTKLIRGWSGHMFSMVQELDETFDALVFIGYHSAGGTNDNPLSHTMNTNIDYMKLNREYLSEFLIHSYIASYLKVPVVFLSGDLGLCNEVKKINENIVTVAVKEGRGNSTISIHPQLALELIRDGVETSLKRDLSLYKIELPEEFNLEIKYRQHADALKALNYKGVEAIDSMRVSFKSKDLMEIVRAIRFLI